MKHFGDITKLNGAELPVVDVITGGSPCQDLSVAGKRAGLAGERSGLFMEQIRIIKEMREHDRAMGRPDGFVRPRFCVWENVKGAFSSNKGADFAAVLTEFARVEEENAPDVPVPEKGWPKNGILYDELGSWSVAWTVHNAADWCVPQRRERISVIADFNGLCAPEILFEREGLRRNPAESGETGQAAAGDSGESYAFTMRERAGKSGGGKGPLVQTEKSGTLDTLNKQAVFEPKCYGNGQLCAASCDPTKANSLDTMHDAQIVVNTYQKTTGALMANSHPGSYTGQDAYGDMLVVDDGGVLK